MELDHRRTTSDAGSYNVGGTSAYGSWEYGGLIDVSDVVGIPDTFLMNIQPHTWTNARFENPDGGTLTPTQRQGSLTIVLKGLAR
jgi:hypothetical protein